MEHLGQVREDIVLIPTTFNPNRIEASSETAKTLVVEQTGNIKGRLEVGNDMVVKGNLWVGKEVKLIGGDMLESRLAFLEESHRQIKEHNEHLIARVNELSEMLAEMKS